MSEFTTVRIPRARHAQLVRLQDEMGAKSIAAVVELLISEEMGRRGLSDGELFLTHQNPSGIVIEPMSVEQDRAVFFGIGTDHPVMLTLSEATRLADALERASEKGAERWRLERSHRGNHTIVVARRGRGVVIELNGNPTAISEGIATSVAAAVRDAIKKAAELGDGVERPVLDPNEPITDRAQQVLNMLRPSDRGGIDAGRIKKIPNAE